MLKDINMQQQIKNMAEDSYFNCLQEFLPQPEDVARLFLLLQMWACLPLTAGYTQKHLATKFHNLIFYYIWF